MRIEERNSFKFSPIFNCLQLQSNTISQHVGAIIAFIFTFRSTPGENIGQAERRVYRNMQADVKI